MLFRRNFSSYSNITVTVDNVIEKTSAMFCALNLPWSWLKLPAQDLRTVSLPHIEHSEGIQWHSANLFVQTGPERSEHSCLLHPWVGFCGFG